MSENNTNQNNQQQPSEPTPGATGGQGGERTFTQSELDRIVQERLARDRASRPTASEREQELTRREQALAEREKAFEDRQFNTALDQALAEARPKNLKAVMALLDMDKVSMVDGKLTGLEEQLTALKKAPDSHFLFEVVPPRRTSMSHERGSEGGASGVSLYAQAHGVMLDDDIADAFKPKGRR